MKNEKLFDAIGYLDEDFLADNLKDNPSRKTIFRGRTLRNLLAAALAVALLGCVVFANTLPAAPEPGWEPYAEADTLLDILFGTCRYSAYEGKVEIRKVLTGKDDGNACYDEVRIPVTSSASREPVSDELAALVESSLISVGETITDPTGTMTLNVMAYLYEPVTRCGAVYLCLTDPTGNFGGYVLDPPVVDAGDGKHEDVPYGIFSYLGMFPRKWGSNYAHFQCVDFRMVEEQSNDTTWTFIVSFRVNENIVDLDIGFNTEPMVDYRPYRVDIDLEQTPTMKTVSLGKAWNKEIVTVSPVSLRIDWDAINNHQYRSSRVVIHFKDGSSYVVADEDACIYGYFSRAGECFSLSNIIDVEQVESVEIDGLQYVVITW